MRIRPGGEQVGEQRSLGLGPRIAHEEFHAGRRLAPMPFYALFVAVFEIGGVELAHPVLAEARAEGDDVCSRLQSDEAQGQVETFPLARVPVVSDSHGVSSRRASQSGRSALLIKNAIYGLKKPDMVICFQFLAREAGYCRLFLALAKPRLASAGREKDEQGPDP